MPKTPDLFREAMREIVVGTLDQWSDAELARMVTTEKTPALRAAAHDILRRREEAKKTGK